MALVTYVLLSGLASGLQSRFHPEILGASFFKALAVIILEFTIIKLGCYLLDVKGGGASGVELIGYGGYKFVGIIASVLMTLLGVGRVVWWSAFVYVYGALLFFLVSLCNDGTDNSCDLLNTSCCPIRPALRPCRPVRSGRGFTFCLLSRLHRFCGWAGWRGCSKGS